ncbi:MAG: molybdopterin-dependent oxidoreductase [Bdellovibrionales bacterium]
MTKIKTSRQLRQRTLMSFAILFLGAAVFFAAWSHLIGQSADDEAPPAFRKTLELNGKIWKALFNPGRVSRTSAPPQGKIPRANGDIGLGDDFDPVHWELVIDSDDQNPSSRKFSVSMKDILALPRTDMATEFRCIEGWSEDMSFAGVKFSDFIKAFNLQSKPYVGLVSSDGEYYVSIDIESMMHEQTLLAYEMNGAPLRPINGAPLRLVIPIKYGIKNLKRIGRIFFSDQRPPDYWAERGYDWYAGL